MERSSMVVFSEMVRGFDELNATLELVCVWLCKICLRICEIESLLERGTKHSL